MTAFSRLQQSPEPQEVWVPAARPRPIAFALGILLIASIGGAAAIIFLIPIRRVFTVTSNGVPTDLPAVAKFALAAVAVVFGLVGLISLVSGNTRRIRLIYEFVASAVEAAAQLEQDALQEDDSYERAVSRRASIIEELSGYEKALLRLGAYEQALQVSRLIARNGGRVDYNIPHLREDQD